MLVPGSEGFVHGRSSRWHVLGNVLSDAFQRSGDARDAFLHASLSDDCASLYAVAACVDANVHGFDVGVDEDADGDADSLVADSGKSAAPIAPGAPSAPVVGFAACPRDEIAASVARVAPAAPLGPPVEPRLAQAEVGAAEADPARRHWRLRAKHPTAAPEAAEAPRVEVPVPQHPLRQTHLEIFQPQMQLACHLACRLTCHLTYSGRFSQLGCHRHSVGCSGFLP